MVEIIVKTLTSSTFTLTVDPHDSVALLKEKIFQLYNQLPVEQQKPVYCGRVLENGSNIQDYNIKDKSVVILLPRLDDPTSTNQADVELDLVFCVDCTGSMGSYIRQAQDNIVSIVEQIVASEKANVRFALIKYRDYPPQDQTFITDVKPFTDSIVDMKQYVDAMSAGGGGDAAEALATGLDEALKLEYRPTATKVCILIADAPPHGLEAGSDGFPDGDPGDHDLIRITNNLADQGIRLYTVGCEPAIASYAYTCSWMKWAAEKCGGRYIPLTSANLLSSVIIAGCREQLNLDRLAKEVLIELDKLKANGEVTTSTSLDEVSAKIAAKLAAKGTTTLAVQFRGSSSNPRVFGYVHVFENSKSLKDAKATCRSAQPVYDDKETKNTSAASSSKNVECVTVSVTEEHVRKILMKEISKGVL